MTEDQIDFIIFNTCLILGFCIIYFFAWLSHRRYNRAMERARKRAKNFYKDR